MAHVPIESNFGSSWQCSCGKSYTTEQGLKVHLATPNDPEDDPVNHPSHYTSDPSGVECITITRHRNFDIGNAIKYLWRAGLKKSVVDETIEKQVEDLRKAIFYIEDEIERIQSVNTKGK